MSNFKDNWALTSTVSWTKYHVLVSKLAYNTNLSTKWWELPYKEITVHKQKVSRLKFDVIINAMSDKN